MIIINGYNAVNQDLRLLAFVLQVSKNERENKFLFTTIYLTSPSSNLTDYKTF